MATNAGISSIGMALAGKMPPTDVSASAPQNSFTATMGRQRLLPTPPNSLSPGLPPHAFKGRTGAKGPDSPTSAAALRHVDSDIDLQDAVDHAYSQDQSQHTPLDSRSLSQLAEMDSTGAITPAMLAKYHLPEILLNHGPLAIRHVMGYLTTSVPGFAGIPPAKARRLVVGALEGRGSGGEGGGTKGDVIFEKVGWGRWDARVRGQPPRDRSNTQSSSASPPSYSQSGLAIPGNGAWSKQGRGNQQQYGRSMGNDSAVFSHSEMEFGDYADDVDNMSLDGEDRDGYGGSSSEAPDELMMEDVGEGDVTDEEDWAQIGAAALRARSIPKNGAGGGFLPHSMQALSRSSHRAGRAPTMPRMGQSVPMAPRVQNMRFPFPNGVAGNAQEQAAAEALMKLGSM